VHASNIDQAVFHENLVNTEHGLHCTGGNAQALTGINPSAIDVQCMHQTLIRLSYVDTRFECSHVDTRFECSHVDTRFECSHVDTRVECGHVDTRFECSHVDTRVKCGHVDTRFDCSAGNAMLDDAHYFNLSRKKPGFTANRQGSEESALDASKVGVEFDNSLQTLCRCVSPVLDQHLQLRAFITRMPGLCKWTPCALRQ
jgi:hypothetical protein